MILRHLLSDERDKNRISPAHTTEQAVSTSTQHSIEVTSEGMLNHYTVYFIAVPLITLLVVALISLVIHLVMRRHRNMYAHQLVLHYDPQEDDAGWESELLDDTEPSFVRDNQRPIVRGTLNIETSSPNGGNGHVIKT